MGKVWDRWAKDDPLWAILTHAGKRGNRWDIDEFMATGQRDVAEVIAAIRRLDLPLRIDRALDFGCGVGRLSQALAATFKRVDGVDGSREYIRIAQGQNFRPDVYFHLNGTDLPFPDAQFDLVLSLITLHHIKPGRQLHYLTEFIRVSRPGGLLAFQLFGFPTTVRGRVGHLFPPLLALSRAIRAGRYRLDAYAVHPDRVRRLLETSGARVVECLRETDHKGYASYRFVAQKHT